MNRIDAMALGRRRALGLALSLALLAWTRGQAAAQDHAPRWRSQPFSLGVASGVPRPDSVLLWTRLLPEAEEAQALRQRASVPVSYEVFSDAALRQLVRRGEIQALASRAHSVHLDLRGLLPSIQQLALVMHGEHDAVTPCAAGEALSHTLPNARFHKIPGAGHALFLSDANAAAALLHEFVDESIATV